MKCKVMEERGKRKIKREIERERERERERIIRGAFGLERVSVYMYAFWAACVRVRACA